MLRLALSRLAVHSVTMDRAHAMTAQSPAPRARGGRAIDHTKDAALRAAALEVLAEVGYDRLTMDMVATKARAGKGTLYRRWSSKAALVIDSITHDRLTVGVPDTGSLVNDLEELAAIMGAAGSGTRLHQVMMGLVSASNRDPELAEALRARIVEPREASIRVILQRARDRGEIAPEVDIELIVGVVPAMIMHRAMFDRLPPDRKFIDRVIRSIVLPSVLKPPRTPPTR